MHKTNIHVSYISEINPHPLPAFTEKMQIFDCNTAVLEHSRRMYFQELEEHTEEMNKIKTAGKEVVSLPVSYKYFCIEQK